MIEVFVTVNYKEKKLQHQCYCEKRYSLGKHSTVSRGTSQKTMGYLN